MFMAALFTMAKWSKQAKSPSMEGLISNMYNMHVMDYSDIKRKEIQVYAQNVWTLRILC